MHPEADRHDAVLVISACREVDGRQNFRARVLAGQSRDDSIEEHVVRSHFEVLDIVARWLSRRAPEE